MYYGNHLYCIHGNAVYFSAVAAIEIAYTKATGKTKKFSEQELTDCYYRGCGGGDYRQVSIKYNLGYYSTQAGSLGTRILDSFL